jgi:RND family efflux transporter MFP subunit
MTQYRTDKRSITGFFALTLLTTGLAGCNSKLEPGQSAAKGQAMPASAATLTLMPQSVQNISRWQGTVQSRQMVKLAAKVSARIVEIKVHPGDKLKKGDVIAKLDDRELRAASDAAHAAQLAAQAQAQNAQAEQKRIVDLYDKQAATRQSYDAVVAQAKAAQALANQAASQARQTQVMAAENILYAPFDGVVAERLLEPGDMASANQAIISFHKPDDLRLQAAVSEQCTPFLKQEMPVQIVIEAIQQTLTGHIDEISPEIDAKTRSQLIKVMLPKVNGLQPGQFGWLQLSCQPEAAALLIPLSAIVHYGQLQAVRVLEGERLHIRHIRTGKQYAEQVQVLSGLQAGETILVEGGLVQ